jgi:1,4-dihydroxy-2-naphthoyl-CoA synthase
VSETIATTASPQRSCARPEKHNAVSPRTNAEMAEAFDEFANDDGLWVAILTGAGDKAFVRAAISGQWSTPKPKPTTRSLHRATGD